MYLLLALYYFPISFFFVFVLFFWFINSVGPGAAFLGLFVGVAIFTMIALGSWGWLIQNLALAALALFAFVRNTGRPLRKVPSILFLLVIIPSVAACLVAGQTLADPDCLFCVPVNLVGVGGSLILGFLFTCLSRQPLKIFGQLDEPDETPS